MGTRDTRDEGDTAPPERTHLSRRAAIKATAATGVGLVGLAAASGSVAAGKGCDINWTGGDDLATIDADTHETDDDWPSNATDMALYIHGWRGRDGAHGQGNSVRVGLQDENYSGDVGVGLWDSETCSVCFYSGEDNADDAGQSLASYLREHGFTSDGGTTMRLIGFSLGGRLVLECVRTLASWDDSVESVSLLGAAVRDHWIEERYWTGISSGTARTHNYYSGNDDVLSDYFRMASIGTNAVGYSGAAGSTPANYTDHDVTSEIDCHSRHMARNDGSLHHVASNF